MLHPFGNELGKPGTLLRLQAVTEIGEGVDCRMFALGDDLVPPCQQVHDPVPIDIFNMALFSVLCLVRYLV